MSSAVLQALPDFVPVFMQALGTNLRLAAQAFALGLPAGIVYADSRAMLEDRVASLREANIYERQAYRHLLGVPLLESADDQSAVARTPFFVARIMHTGETMLFASGEYRDRYVKQDGKLLLAERVAVCDSTETDTLLALPL